MASGGYMADLTNLSNQHFNDLDKELESNPEEDDRAKSSNVYLREIIHNIKGGVLVDKQWRNKRGDEKHGKHAEELMFEDIQAAEKNKFTADCLTILLNKIPCTLSRSNLHDCTAIFLTELELPKYFKKVHLIVTKLDCSLKENEARTAWFIRKQKNDMAKLNAKLEENHGCAVVLTKSIDLNQYLRGNQLLQQLNEIQAKRYYLTGDILSEQLFYGLNLYNSGHSVLDEPLGKLEVK